MPRFASKTQTQDTAVFASSAGESVHGETTSETHDAIVGRQLSASDKSMGAGVFGQSVGGGPAVKGINTASATSAPAAPGGPGGYFSSEQREGVIAETQSPVSAAISGIQKNPNGTGAALYAEHITGGTAGFFKGNIIVTGDISFPGADFAEDFDVLEVTLSEPGTVMMFDESGALVPSTRPYERKVVGVVAGAGAGSFRTGIVMDKQDGSASRRPIALVGKVFCKVDATYGPVSIGDLLTSSATPGHAMKASDSRRAFGAVLGKAMRSLSTGRGLIPILISLQ